MSTTGRDEAMTGLTLDEPELQHIAALTVQHYDARAEAFRAGTHDHDVNQNIDALLRHIVAPAPLTILDFGCGPGRDLAAFSRLGHLAIGLEGSPRFVQMAREFSGCEVWQQNFMALNLPAERFDGIFANASLFHVPCQELCRVLGQLRASLKPGGVMFSSNPRGNGEEGWHAGRYGVLHDLSSWRRHLGEAGFSELEHYYRPTGLPPEQQAWLASVWRNSLSQTPPP